ncbi:transcriptional repressor LexA [Paraclostridium sordellii]|uniref:transcriptional repressor LexA n=2 Tax=Paraclostridium sordellii TaxID=1505 RepID=UPI0005DDD764|nr:transcriptional repressor LexA [Paeniclostridium sordellii]CEN23178.1 SOS regulatory protein [[Clostridium] sordellii] [Paeniclostridium sordellii]CEN24199.1 SOS regulatory protein [[Clostridium] sordellii] [Paeniclostridium sordellii]CEN26231.1 SOS regulatory protein [[Clostridium] sordellii] [Paeniclostridium sordellii]DAU04063.1 MAG TPA: LexA repressor [Caudoviricetes sp.]
MINLSENQNKILKSIRWKIKEFGYPPSVREICALTDIRSTSTVHFHMNKLEKLGYIKRDPSKPRAIEILEYEKFIPGFNQEIIELPVIEFFKGKFGIEENIKEIMKLPYSMTLGKDNFVFKVSDDRLIEIGVLKNDYVIVDRRNKIDNEKLIIGIMDNNEIILGKYFKNKYNTELKFENCFYDPLIVDNNKLKIVGQITGYFGIIK